MDYFLIGLAFWLLVILSLMLFVHGFLEKSWQKIVFSGFAFLIPMLYFSMFEKFFLAFALLAAAPFIVVYNLKKKEL